MNFLSLCTDSSFSLNDLVPSISFEDGLKLVKLRGEAMQVSIHDCQCVLRNNIMIWLHLVETDASMC